MNYGELKEDILIFVIKNKCYQTSIYLPVNEEEES